MANVTKEVRAARSEHMKKVNAARAQRAEADSEVMSQLAQEGLSAPAAAPRERKAERPRRNLFNGTQQRMAVHGHIPGYHLHIFNDYPGRVEQALASGYEFVKPGEVEIEASRRVTDTNTAVDDKIRYVAGVGENNLPLYAYLMKIPQEWFEQDQKESQDKIAANEQQMIRDGGVNTAAIGPMYVPDNRKAALEIKSVLK